MRLLHRKLLPELCETICHEKEPEPCSQDCKVCIKICLTNPFYSPPTLPQQFPPPLQPDYDSTDQGNSHKVSTYLFLALAILTAAFFVVCCHALYTRFISRRRVLSRQQVQETRHDDGDDFVDEEDHHGPMVDHPIWYIRTLGLQQSVISAITVCKYKKGEGLIEGTDCAVCLSEFEEDESLRLLPKCHHAFHLPCIDTWLRSHTNCPLCRVPIVTDLASARMESNFVDSNSLENNHIQVLESTQNSAPDSELLNREGEEEGQLEVEGGLRVSETETTVEELTVIRPRRSASLDSSVANIHFALAKALQEESNGNSNRVLERIDDSTASKFITTGNDLPATSSSRGSSSFRLTTYLQGVPSSMKRSQSYNGKYLLSWYGRSQRKPNASLRSF